MAFNQQFVNIVLTFAGFGSVAVWALAIRKWTVGQQPLPLRETPSVRWDHWTVLAAFAIWSVADQIVYYAFGVGAETAVPERVRVICVAGGLKTVLLLALILLNIGMSYREMAPDARRVWGDVKTGLWGLLASLLPVWGVAELIEPLRSPKNGHPFLQEIRAGADPATLAWMALAVLVVAPLFEELVFRVILQGWLHKHVSPTAAVVGVAIGFAAVHSSAWPDPLPLIPLSLVLGYIYYRRRSYLANVVTHALFNGVNLMMALSGGE